MEPRRSKAPWIILVSAIGAALTGGIALFLAAASYFYFRAAPLPAAVNASAAPSHSELAEKARLPDDSRDLASEADDHFKSGNYGNAAADYRQIIDKHPDCLYAWSNLGVTLFTSGDYKGALTALQKSVELSPSDAFSWSNLGITYFQLGRFDEALDALQKAIAITPSDAKSHNYLGCCLSKKGRQADAQVEFKKAIELNPNFADAYFNLALVLAYLKPPEVAQARQNYQHALQLGDDHNPQLEKLLADESQAQ